MFFLVLLDFWCRAPGRVRSVEGASTGKEGRRTGSRRSWGSLLFTGLTTTALFPERKYTDRSLPSVFKERCETRGRENKTQGWEEMRLRSL